MNRALSLTRAAIAMALVAVCATSAVSASDPSGIWIDHTGRGAVEIADCGGRMCGKLVWLKDGKNGQVCGRQIIGDAKPMSSGKWDGGWIYDPEEDEKYSVELTPMGDQLKVVGYMGSKIFSKTMIWKRAPADLKRCV